MTGRGGVVLAPDFPEGEMNNLGRWQERRFLFQFRRENFLTNKTLSAVEAHKVAGTNKEEKQLMGNFHYLG